MLLKGRKIGSFQFQILMTSEIVKTDKLSQGAGRFKTPSCMKLPIPTYPRTTSRIRIPTTI